MQNKQKSTEEKLCSQRQDQVVAREFLPDEQYMPKHLPSQCLATAERSRALRGGRDTGNSRVVARERGIPCMVISLPIALKFPVLLMFTTE